MVVEKPVFSSNLYLKYRIKISSVDAKGVSIHDANHSLQQWINNQIWQHPARLSLMNHNTDDNIRNIALSWSHAKIKYCIITGQAEVSLQAYKSSRARHSNSTRDFQFVIVRILLMWKIFRLVYTKYAYAYCYFGWLFAFNNELEAQWASRHKMLNGHLLSHLYLYGCVNNS